MRRARTARALGAAAVAACLLAACSTSGGARRRAGGGPAAEPVRLWMAPIVRWDRGVARDLEFSVENATDRTLAVAAPDAAQARVAVFSRPDGVRVCGVEPRADAAPGAPVELAPGDRLPVRVDLAEACGAIPPGEYRYEVTYRIPPPGGGGGGAEAGGRGPRTFSGTLATTHGEVLVEGEPWPGRREAPARAARRPPRSP